MPFFPFPNAVHPPCQSRNCRQFKYYVWDFSKARYTLTAYLGPQVTMYPAIFSPLRICLHSGESLLNRASPRAWCFVGPCRRANCRDDRDNKINFLLISFSNVPLFITLHYISHDLYKALGFDIDTFWMLHGPLVVYECNDALGI